MPASWFERNGLMSALGVFPFRAESKRVCFPERERFIEISMMS